MSYFSDDSAVEGYGPLTVGDLAARADRAYQALSATYTASAVLHELWVAALGDDDAATREAVGIAFIGLRAYRARTRAAWRTARLAWAEAAGIPLMIAEETDDPDRFAVYLEYPDNTGATGEQADDPDASPGFRQDEEPDLWDEFDQGNGDSEGPDR